MKTITLDVPLCVLCKQVLSGPVIELTSGKRLHEPCVEDAAELGLKNALTLTRREEPETFEERKRQAWTEIQVEYAADRLLERAENTPRNLGGLSLSEAIEVVCEAAGIEPSTNGTAEPKAESTRYVPVAEECAEWLKTQLANGERMSAEIAALADEAGYSRTTLGKARSKLNIENRPVMEGNRTKGWAMRLPGDTRLIQAEPITEEATEESPAEETPELPHGLPPEPESIPDNAPSIPDSEPEPSPSVIEPLTPESYVRRREALRMTDATIAHWAQNVTEAGLQLYVTKKNLLGEEAARRVEALLSRLEAETDPEKLNAYRYPLDRTGTDNMGARMFGPAYARLG
jgi:hypothetical protein